MPTTMQDLRRQPVNVVDEEKGSGQEIRDKKIDKTEKTMPLDAEVLVGSLRDGRLRVLSPFSVRFSSEGSSIIAEATEFNEFGFGENWSEALLDLQYAIVELYFSLEGGQDRLGSDLQNVWSVLQQKIQKIQK